MKALIGLRRWDPKGGQYIDMGRLRLPCEVSFGRVFVTVLGMPFAFTRNATAERTYQSVRWMDHANGPAAYWLVQLLNWPAPALQRWIARPSRVRRPVYA